MNRFKFVLMFFLILLISTAVLAQIPRTLSYQGILTDKDGKTRVDKNYQFTFCLYDTATGGSALWTEQKTLPVTAGLFSTILGDQKPFGAAVKFDKQYWLGIQVENEAELSPRIQLTSVGYSLNAVRAETARVAMTSGSWTENSSNIYRLNGNVGIGLDVPEANLHIRATPERVGLRVEGRSTWWGATISGNGTIGQSYGLQVTGGTDASDIALRVADALDKTEFMRITGAGNIGIGLTLPETNLHVRATPGRIGLRVEGSATWWGATVGGNGTIGQSYGLQVTGGTDPSDIALRVADALNKTEFMRITGSGNIGIGTSTPTEKFEVSGRIKTQVLEITGADFAEPFEMSHTDSLPLGSLVVIDPEHPGQLKQATESYDKRVAGVISGAGGIYPGIMVTKDVKLNNSQYVAMTGKVYALATAANGAIEPGDLLTTSGVPGHAMKATDQTRAFGTVIGKAMSGLKEGEGFVLILVNLQ